jgi:uncharacterized protein YcbX
VRQIATVRAIARYPVKSMRGETLDAVDLTLMGVPGDREYAFVQARSRSPFPWLTGRQLAGLLRYQPVGEGDGRLFVTTPTGQSLPVDGEALRLELEAASGRSLYLLRDRRGSFDVAAISLITAATVAAIAAAGGVAPDFLRFRPNLLVDTAAAEPFAERRWVGHVLRVGAARVAVTEEDERCAMITLDPWTGEAAPEVLRVVAQEQGNRAGVYGTVLAAGTLRTGDPLYLE